MLLYAKRGAFAGAAAFLMTFIAAIASINYYTLIQYVIVWAFEPMAEYADALGFLISFLVVFLFLQYLAVTFLEEHVQMNIIANTLAGGIFGGLSAVLLGGLLAISWLMLPGSAYFISTDEKAPTVWLGADELFLQTARFMANDRIKGSTPFDPTHTFMKTHTNKQRGSESFARERTTTERRPSSTPGVADEVDVDRTPDE